MLIEWMISVAYTMFKAIVGLFPPIPPLNSVITDGADLILDSVDNVMGVVVYFIGTPLFIAGTTIIIFLDVVRYLG